METELKYLRGFGNHFRSEALPGALPDGQNNPQKCPYGLYAEQLSGTAFTKFPREKNLRTWLYRIRPSVQHSKMIASKKGGLGKARDEPEKKFHIDPNQTRWRPMEIPAKGDAVTFLDGIINIGKSGSPKEKKGVAVHIYAFNESMENECLTNADGDLLLVPQEGEIQVQTEFGVMRVMPTEICVIQRGMRFSIKTLTHANRGYILELFEGHFSLPELGPIGANGLANPIDFEVPVAKYEHTKSGPEWTMYTKFGGHMFEMTQEFSPFNVVAYNGNYVPYKYDLKKFCAVISGTYDHLDPSIFTVLTCQSNEPGVAVVDFVVFPPRWLPMEHTFRPPYFHRNTMTEFMGLIWGNYDAKKANSFVPGGSSLHSCMTPHGPDADTFNAASDPEKVDTSKPIFYDQGLAFMFETSCLLELSTAALNSKYRDLSYQQCWQSIPDKFDPEAKPTETGTNLLEWRKHAQQRKK